MPDRVESRISRLAFLASVGGLGVGLATYWISDRKSGDRAGEQRVGTSLLSLGRPGPVHAELRASELLGSQSSASPIRLWSAPDGSPPAWIIEGGWIRPRGLSLFKPSSESRDGLINLKVQIMEGSAGMVVRAKDFRNYYSVHLAVTGDSPSPNLLVRANLVENGTERLIHEERLSRYLDGIRSLYDWSLKMEGNFFCALVGGSPIAVWRDKTLPHGAVGLTSRDEDLFRIYSGSMQLS
jgi:hypothetical protein